MHGQAAAFAHSLRPRLHLHGRAHPAASLLCGTAMEGAPPAKKRKIKNKFKPDAQKAAQPAAPPLAAAALHATAAGQAKKKKRKKQKHAAAADETVAAQPDAPGAVQQQQRPPLPLPAGRGPGGRSVFAPPAASGGGKKGKGEAVTLKCYMLEPMQQCCDHCCSLVHAHTSSTLTCSVPQAAAACCSRCGSACRAAASAG